MLFRSSNISEPLLEMSCLQSLNDLFDAVGYVKSDGLSALPKAIASAATSYLTQALPTLLGQAERTGEEQRAIGATILWHHPAARRSAGLRKQDEPAAQGDPRHAAGHGTQESYRMDPIF